LIGGGVGIGVVAGSLYRNQVSPTGASIDPNNPGSAIPCAAPGIPGTVAPSGIPYCDASNKHYPNGGQALYSEPSWAGGGSKPIVFPWLSLPQLSFRYKPIRQVQLRADFGFSMTGFFFGMSAAYGLPIGGNVKP
jgi:hypothetical protein